VQGISAGESGRQAVVPKQQPRIREEEKKMPQINPRGISQAPGSGIVRVKIIILFIVLPTACECKI
jgi:hypothetical protein